MRYDVAILGAGPAGIAAAFSLARGGKKVAVVENRQAGGTCLNRGCIPTKMLLGGIAPLELVLALKKQKVLSGEVGVERTSLLWAWISSGAQPPWRARVSSQCLARTAQKALRQRTSSLPVAPAMRPFPAWSRTETASSIRPACLPSRPYPQACWSLVPAPLGLRWDTFSLPWAAR